MPLELPQTPGERATGLTGGSAITRNRKKIAGLLERDEKKIPDNIVSIDREIYLRLTRVCQTGILNGEKNGIARLILTIVTPSIFFICHDVDRLRNFLHESLILGQMGGNGVRFDRDGLSLDAIAEVFLGINREQIQFSRKAYAEDDSKNAHIRNLYRDTDTNHAARIFFMEHPGLIPYAGYITKKLFPFGIGRSCYVGAGGNGIVIRNSESNLAFKFYYDLSRKKIVRH